MAHIECDRCGKTFDATPTQEGKATCPYCGDVNRVRFDAATSATAIPDRRETRAPEKASVADETTLLVVRPALFRAHPFAYGGLILLAFAGVVVTVLPLFSVVMGFVSLLGVALIVAAVIGFLKMFVFSHRWYRLRITDRRTVDERGIVTRRHSEVLHDHAVNIRISQTVWQRLMKLGDFEIESAAGGSIDPESGVRTSTEISIKDIPDPYGVKALIDQHRRV
ncbi:MAG: PH domain-containing protein [Phycisphaerae bacterium]|nr:PH domain-containing protein [Phycisphaerae bacterium]